MGLRIVWFAGIFGCYTFANAAPKLTPRAGKLSTITAAPGPTGDEGSVSTPTILCIDDEALGLQIRKAVLERAGYQVLTAVDGPTGLNLFRSHPIDGVVLDYYMPEMDGGAVAETMRRERPDIPIMLLSAYINLPAEVVTLVDVTLLKGEGPVELLDKLQSMLRAGDGSGTAGVHGPGSAA